MGGTVPVTGTTGTTGADRRSGFAYHMTIIFMNNNFKVNAGPSTLNYTHSVILK